MGWGSKTDRIARRSSLFISTVLCLVTVTACGSPKPEAGTTAPEATPGPVEVDVELGPGSFDLPDAAAGLADLSSYQAALTVAFEGSEAGGQTRWSNTSVFAFNQDPEARMLSFETTADPEASTPELRLELNGTAYYRPSGGACTAAVVPSEDSEIEAMHPAIALMGVLGAEEAGPDSIEGIATKHYTFDERALAQAGLTTSSGELWVAEPGGYLVRYLVTSEAGEDYFGEGMQGTLTWDYQLSSVNQPITMEPPADCPPGRVDAPMLEDASVTLNLPGILEYETASSIEDAFAFYQQELPALGWAAPNPMAMLQGLDVSQGITPEELQMLLGDMQAMGLDQAAPPVFDSGQAFLDFERGNQAMRVMILRGEARTTVRITLSRSFE